MRLAQCVIISNWKQEMNFIFTNNKCLKFHNIKKYRGQLQALSVEKTTIQRANFHPTADGEISIWSPEVDNDLKVDNQSNKSIFKHQLCELQ